MRKCQTIPTRCTEDSGDGEGMRMCQKRPTYVAKEAYYHWCVRPTYAAKAANLPLVCTA